MLNIHPIPVSTNWVAAIWYTSTVSNQINRAYRRARRDSDYWVNTWRCWQWTSWACGTTYCGSIPNSSKLSATLGLFRVNTVVHWEDMELMATMSIVNIRNIRGADNTLHKQQNVLAGSIRNSRKAAMNDMPCTYEMSGR